MCGLKKILWVISTILAVSISGYAFVQYFILGPSKSGFVITKIQSGEVLNQLWYTMLYIHAFSSLLALVIGPFLLSRKIRNKNLERHKLIGKLYFICIFFGGLTGIYLAFKATGGTVATLGFGFLSIFWLATGSMAFYRIRQRQIQLHRKWMIRNYLLTFAAVTLRIWLLIFILIDGLENYITSYMVISWLCWVPNLLVAELYVRKTGTKLKSDLLDQKFS
ncbi:hypothetical protein BN982_02463 [Halobacillus karajensis]|uniref:Membrane protein (DUF2306) n=2 Tax=Halobacillus karajensis TaxID=195088 RepID=A0A024P8Z2_9BACI|nr:hypothetical protein BN982_02463 [Halobacillus karajensis]CDQ25191.1 hypothetical protein BN983_03502 [Halobacillus karajensis]CDQ28448.1 hypothetical protein BN981_02750 [Halobacillus karajensis]